MSALLARVMLAIFMLPIAAIVYTVTVVLSFELFGMRTSGTRDAGWWMAGGVTWAFIAAYWIALWHGSVQWTAARRLLTLGAVMACAVIGVVVATFCNAVERGFGTFVGTAIAPLLWLAVTTFIWRESATERGQRLAGSAHAIVCPACGYNLTGLQTPRCPECGKQYTLDELLAAQPSRAAGDL